MKNSQILTIGSTLLNLVGMLIILIVLDSGELVEAPIPGGTAVILIIAIWGLTVFMSGALLRVIAKTNRIIEKLDDRISELEETS